MRQCVGSLAQCVHFDNNENQIGAIGRPFQAETKAHKTRLRLRIGRIGGSRKRADRKRNNKQLLFVDNWRCK